MAGAWSPAVGGGITVSVSNGLIVPTTDRASDILGIAHDPLQAVFAPRSLAVIGASARRGSVGRTLLWSPLSSPFDGTVYPVHSERQSVLGVKAYPHVGSLPEPAELVIATPAATVPDIVEECVTGGRAGSGDHLRPVQRNKTLAKSCSSACWSGRVLAVCAWWGVTREHANANRPQ